MKVTLDFQSFAKVVFHWYGPVEHYNGKLTFYASENTRAKLTEAEKLANLFPTLFDFNFYREEGVKKVIFSIKKDCTAIFE